jgi:hypothetical protein
MIRRLRPRPESRPRRFGGPARGRKFSRLAQGTLFSLGGGRHLPGLVGYSTATGSGAIFDGDGHRVGDIPTVRRTIEGLSAVPAFDRHVAICVRTWVSR